MDAENRESNEQKLIDIFTTGKLYTFRKPQNGNPKLSEKETTTNNKLKQAFKKNFDNVKKITITQMDKKKAFVSKGENIIEKGLLMMAILMMIALSLGTVAFGAQMLSETDAKKDFYRIGRRFKLF